MTTLLLLAIGYAEGLAHLFRIRTASDHRWHMVHAGALLVTLLRILFLLLGVSAFLGGVHPALLVTAYLAGVALGTEHCRRLGRVEAVPAVSAPPPWPPRFCTEGVEIRDSMWIGPTEQS